MVPSAILYHLCHVIDVHRFLAFCLTVHVLLGPLHAHLLFTQEAVNRVLRPIKDVRCDQAELTAGEGHVVRRRVLSLAHRQQ